MNETISIDAFNGGINNVIEPHLLQNNFAKDIRNGEIHNGAIKSARGSSVIDPTESELIFQNGNRSIIKWNGFYYFTDNITGEMSSTEGYMGVPKPQTLMRAREGKKGGRFPASSAYKYLYTYFTDLGYRSAPYSVTDYTEIVIGAEDRGVIHLTGFDETNLPDYATGFEVWRTIDGGSEFFKVGEAGVFSLNGDDIEYQDKIPDGRLILNEKLDLTATDDIPDTGKYLCERNSVFYIAEGDKVYFSKQSNPHSFPALNNIIFDDTITGMIATEDFTMVFTRNRAYVLTGDSLADIRKDEIPDSQGVSNWKTVSRVKNMPVWVSNDGLCAYQPFDNRSGRKITVLTENLFDLELNPFSAAVANDVYYLFYANETIAFDFLTNLKIYRLDWKFDWAWYDKDNDMLVGKKGETYYNAAGGDEMEFEYTSPEFVANDMHRLKMFGRMHVDSDCDLEMTFYAEGTEVWRHTLELADLNQRTEFISSLVEGRRIQVKVSGVGTLRGLRFDYQIRRL